MLDKTVDGKYTLIGLEEKGEAFQAHLAHYHLLGTQVMLDLVYPGRLDGGDAEFTSRLDTLLTLRAPGIRRVFAWGEEEDYFFVVREYVPGTLLSELLRDSGGLPAAQALSLLRSLVDGLGALHGRGVYFIGLNPHQVWVGRDGSAGIIRPGYSYLLECGDERLSREAAQYWAPEVVAGGEGTRASDVFSLGTMAKRLLSPLRGDRRLWGMLREASAFEPSRRPPSARVFMENLEGIISEPPGRVDEDAPPGSREEVSPGRVDEDAPPDGKTASGPEGTWMEMKPDNEEAGLSASGRPQPRSSFPDQAPCGDSGHLDPRERLSQLFGPDQDFCCEPSRGRPGRKWLLLAGAAAAALGLICALSLCIWKPSGTSQPVVVTRAAGTEGSYQEQLLTMPDLRGMDSAQARRMLHEMGLEVEVVSEPNNAVPEGKVIIQEPMKGETMHKGSMVKVYVSKGPLQQQTRGLGHPDKHMEFITKREPLPGRGNVIVEPRGPSGPGEPAARQQESPGHGA